VSDDRTTGDDTDATAAARATATKERIARDENLVKAAKSGEPKAYGRLFDAWFDHVWDRATQRGIPSSEVGDLATSVFASTWHAIDSGENASFGTMVMRETRTAMPSGVKAPSAGNPGGARPEDRLTRATDLRTIAADGDVAGMLWEAGGVLGDRGRDVLDLHFRHGLTPNEIAAVLSLKAADVDTLVGKVPSAFANAVRARLLWRGGTPEDDELKADLQKAGKKTFDADAVRIIHARAKQSPRTRGRAMTPLAPIDVFAAIPVSAAPTGLKEKVAGSLDRQSIPVIGSQYLKKEDDATGGAAAAAGAGAAVAAGAGIAAATSGTGDATTAKTDGPGKGAGATAGGAAAGGAAGKTDAKAGEVGTADAAKSGKGGKAAKTAAAAAGGAAVGATATKAGAAKGGGAGASGGGGSAGSGGSGAAGGGGAELSAAQRQAQDLEDAAAKKKQMTIIGVAAGVAIFLILAVIVLKSGGSNDEVSTGNTFGTNTTTTRAGGAADQRPATSPPPTSSTTAAPRSTTTSGNSTTTAANTTGTICEASGTPSGEDGGTPTTCVPVTTAPSTTATTAPGGGGAGGGGAGGGGGGGGGGNTTAPPTTAAPTAVIQDFSFNPGTPVKASDLASGATTVALNWTVATTGTVTVSVTGWADNNAAGFNRTDPSGFNVGICPGLSTDLGAKCNTEIAQYDYTIRVTSSANPSLVLATQTIKLTVKDNT